VNRALETYSECSHVTEHVLLATSPIGGLLLALSSTEALTPAVRVKQQQEQAGHNLRASKSDLGITVDYGEPSTANRLHQVN
jgi:hypothetical protein